MKTLNSNSWNNRYLDDNTPWDAGSITTPLKEYVDQLAERDIKILIPGAGNAHEAEYLHQQGFSNVFICDWAEKAIAVFLERVLTFPENHAIAFDFFDLEPGYDLIIEQTFFCAIDPSLRDAYARKIKELLNPGGKLVGLLFKELPIPKGPPFGGTREEYLKLFRQYFGAVQIEPCHNSIPPRMGNELFISISA
ncbi:MAG: SAM-dependent methyltransferase [Bacteroidota bacterium]